MKTCCFGLIMGLFIGAAGGFQSGLWWKELSTYRHMYGSMFSNTNIELPRMDIPDVSKRAKK